LKHTGFFFEADKLKGEVVGFVGLEDYGFLPALDGDFFYVLGMTAVKGVGDSQDGRHFKNQDAVFALKGNVFDVGLCRRVSAVVVNDVCDKDELFVLQAEDFRIGDDVLAVFLVARGFNEGPDVVEDGGGFQEDAVAAVHAVLFYKGVE
jgi:hypothetical protein